MSFRKTLYLILFLIISLLLLPACAEETEEDIMNTVYQAFLEEQYREVIDINDLPSVKTGNIYLEYFGIEPFSAQSVGMRAWSVCDQPLFVVHTPSLIKVSAEGGSAPYRCTYNGYRVLMSASDKNKVYRFGKENAAFYGSFSIVPDDEYLYLFMITVVDQDGNYISFSSNKYYTVSQDSFSTPGTLGNRVKTVVQQVITPDMSEFEKALALHDWLINNADYDFNYENYGPDGVLLQGRGVCESYATAYEILLAQVGIQSIFVGSNAINHAWNMVNINGAWYHVDVTWDDGGAGEAPYRTYFCLTDDQMQLTESCMEPEDRHIWGEYANSENGLYQFHIPPATEKMQYLHTGRNDILCLNNRQILQLFKAPVSGAYSFYSAGEHAVYAVLYEDRAGQQVITGAFPGSGAGNNFTFSVTLEKGQEVLLLLEIDRIDDGEEIQLWIDSLTSVFILPSDTLVIGQNAFDGCNIQYLVIPSGCMQIRSGAFSNCRSLKYVEFLGDLPAIAQDAFSGCPQARFYDAEGVQIIMEGFAFD